MRSGDGFTLLELLVALVILGILSATAIPFYHTWTQRAYGTEASIMMKQILDGEVMYYLEHDGFFPTGSGADMTLRGDGSADPADAFTQIRDALKVDIPPGHHLDYHIINGGGFCAVRISSSPPPGFPLFKNRQKNLNAVIDTEGKVDYFSDADFFTFLTGL